MNITKKPTPVVCYLQPSAQPLTAGPARATWLPWVVLQDAMASVRDARKAGRLDTGAPGLTRGFLNLVVGREESLKLARVGHQNLCLLTREFNFETTDPNATQEDWDKLHAQAAQQAVDFAKETSYPLPWLDVDINVMIDGEWFDNAKSNQSTESKGVRMFIAELQNQGVTIKPVLLGKAEWAKIEKNYMASLDNWLDPVNAGHWDIVQREQDEGFAEAARLEVAPRERQVTHIMRNANDGPMRHN